MKNTIEKYELTKSQIEACKQIERAFARAKKLGVRFLAKQYDIDIDQLNITDVQLREFTQNAINFLKRKGSYASIYIIWRTMTRTPQDVLTIFDRWHEAKYTGSIPTSAWKDYEYTKIVFLFITTF